ncbi:N-acetyltransferase [Vreelandella titanicae]|uniref:N-acetyltransferase n=1 Tax=Vreelandella titanicae TaxID=664683 RepID=UPI00114357BD|nr:N-acetyltransferase [Halomonas titanicae]
MKILFSPWSRITRRSLPVVEVRLSIKEGAQTFVEPNPDFRANILNGSMQEVGTATFGKSPLDDTIYVYQIDVYPQHRRRGYALAFLCWLYNEHQLPITPIHIVGSANGFWHAACRLGVGPLVVRDDLRVSEMDEEKARWAHLIPEPEYMRLQRLCAGLKSHEMKFISDSQSKKT